MPPTWQRKLFMKIHSKTVASKMTVSRLQSQIITGFDRITLWLDHQELPCSEEHLSRHCTKLTTTVNHLTYNPQWMLKVDLHQPTIKCLNLLTTSLGQDINTLICYVEIACDLPTSKKQAQCWLNYFLGESHVKNQRQTVKHDKTVWYYGRRTKVASDDQTTKSAGKKVTYSDKRGNVLAVYADKSSKINNAQPNENASLCLHIEYRTTGSTEISRLGIASLEDLIKFNHMKFWNKHVCMYSPLKTTKLGRWLAKAGGTDLNVSGSALYERGKKWKIKHSIDDIFVLHNAWLETQQLRKTLKPLPFETWVDNLFNRKVQN
jgi:hypothetical protein